MKPIFRVDHVGSLKRPKVLLDEVYRIYETGHTALLAEERAKDRTRLNELEDEAVRAAVRRQLDIGLPAVTDGEFRRVMYFNSFFDAVEGVAPSRTKRQFYDDDGSVVEHEGPVEIVSRLRKIDSPAAREVAFTRTLTDRPVKVTFPTASFVYLQAVLGQATDGSAYASPAEAADHLVTILRELVDDAVDAGAGFVEFDVSGYMVLKGSGLEGFLRSQGHDVDALLATMLELDRRVVEGLPAHVTTGLHQCRGNYASRYMSKHDRLGELGETLFSLPYDRFQFEWDDYIERTDADYEALSRVPQPGPTVVLGVVSTRRPQIETVNELARKVEQAARYLPVEQLAISPQCGFASAVAADRDQPDGNLIDEDTQWRKLEVLVSAAERVWG